MAKKKQSNVETVEVKTPVVDKIVTPKKVEPKWEIRDRMYVLKNNLSPLTYTIRSSGLFWFDEEKGYERQISYASNQRTPFNDEMEGPILREHIVFRNGILVVPKEKTILQKFLSNYHPGRNKLYEEVNKTQEAHQEYDYLEFELAAMNLANEMSIEEAEAVLRVERGSAVSKMTTKEIRRDLLVMARKNPSLFVDVAQDENIHLRNIGIKATEEKIIELSPDQRYFSWTSTGRKLMTVPFDEHPYSALAAWFKTDEGMEIYSAIEKRLN